MVDGAPPKTPEKTFLESFFEQLQKPRPSEKKARGEKPTPAQVFGGSLEVISASELELYAYCPLNWWLDRQGQKAEGAEAAEGELAHERSGKVLEKARKDDIEASRSEAGVLWFAVVATILATVGIAAMPFALSEPFAKMLSVVALIWLLAASFFLYRFETIPHKEEKTKYEALILVFGMVATVLTIVAVTLALIVDPLMARVLEVTAVAWLIGASLFFYYSLKKRSSAAAAKKGEGLDEKAELEYVDELAGGRKPRMFYSEKYGLRGRPDLILMEEGRHVPVELKTGRTPRGPLFSHILQLAAYMLLVEEALGQPREGILRYSERDDRIEWSDELKMMVSFKLDEMRQRLKTGDLHRNHNRPGKCRGCSRRAGCPEKLE